MKVASLGLGLEPELFRILLTVWVLFSLPRCYSALTSPQLRLFSEAQPWDHLSHFGHKCKKLQVLGALVPRGQPLASNSLTGVGAEKPSFLAST